MIRIAATACFALTTLVAGCTVAEFEPGYESGGIGPIEAQARNNCVGAVRRTTGAAVSIMSSTYSATGTEVVMRALPDQTWRCVASSDGTIANLALISDDG